MHSKHYAYRVIWSEDDQEFVGLCDEFPSISWLENDQEAALKGIVALVDEILEDMKEHGEEAPEPTSLQKHS